MPWCVESPRPNLLGELLRLATVNWTSSTFMYAAVMFIQLFLRRFAFALALRLLLGDDADVQVLHRLGDLLDEQTLGANENFFEREGLIGGAANGSKPFKQSFMAMYASSMAAPTMPLASEHGDTSRLESILLVGDPSVDVRLENRSGVQLARAGSAALLFLHRDRMPEKVTRAIDAVQNVRGRRTARRTCGQGVLKRRGDIRRVHLRRDGAQRKGAGARRRPSLNGSVDVRPLTKRDARDSPIATYSCMTRSLLFTASLRFSLTSTALFFLKHALAALVMFFTRISIELATRTAGHVAKSLEQLQGHLERRRRNDRRNALRDAGRLASRPTICSWQSTHTRVMTVLRECR